MPKKTGSLYLCIYCKSIRNSMIDGFSLEAYISEHSEAFFAHEICPEGFEEEIRKISSEEGITAPAENHILRCL